MMPSPSAATMPSAQSLSFTTVPALYNLRPGATADDLGEQLGVRLSQLRAMLVLIRGEGFEPFSEGPRPVAQEYIWACSTLAEECCDLACAIDRSRMQPPTDEVPVHG